MPLSGNPLAALRRFGTVADLSSLPNSIGVNIGGDNAGNTWDSGNIMYCSYANDYRAVLADTVMLIGIPGDWTIVCSTTTTSSFTVDATGPGSQTDYSAGATVCTATVSVINGRKYRLGGYILGTQVTVQGNTSVRILAGGSEVGPSTRLISRVLAINELAVGYAAYRWQATSTASVAFTLLAGTTAGAFRVSANGAQITVNDDGV